MPGTLGTFLLLLVGLCFSVAGELMLKHGMNQVGRLDFTPGLLAAGLFRTFTNPYVLLGFASVFTASIFWLGVLSRAPLSWAWPLLSLSYVFGVLLSWLVLGESLSFSRLAGVLIICFGVFLVYRSA